MSKPKLNLALTAALLLAGIAQLSAQAPTPLLTQPEDKLIATLKSDATQKEKADACRELAVIGTKKAVPALAALLGDEKLSHMARYGLETIPDPSVDAALLDALGKLKGRPQAGVIGSLGVRRDTKAIKPLSVLLQDSDADVAQASARALGKIGTPAAVQALEGALATVSAGNQLAVCEGLFRCAEAFAASRRPKEAMAIYDRLRTIQGPHQVRAGALRGAILTRQKEGLPLLVEAMRGNDFVLVDAAARTAMEMPGSDVTMALATEFPKLSADKQVLLTMVLGKRGDAAAVPALSAAAKSGDKTVRIAAIRALPEIGSPSVGPVLAGLVVDSDRQIAQAAQEGLAAIPGREVDAAVLAMLNSSETDQRLAAIDLIGRRKLNSAIPALLKAAGDADAKIRPAAIKRVGELGGPAELPALLDLLVRSKDSQDLDAVEQAVSAVCAKAGSPESSAGKVIALLPQAQPAQKGALLRVLASIGEASALNTVRAAVNDSNSEVRAAAIRALGDWKTVDAAPALLELAKASSNPSDRSQCVRSSLRLVADSDAPTAQRLSICRQAAELIQQDDEKKLLLGALGSIKTTESLALVAPFLEQPATKEEASAATVAIAEALLKGGSASEAAPKLIEPLQKASQATANFDLARRARTSLRQAQNRAGGS